MQDSHRTMGSHPEWIKSSLSFANGNCVEVADMGGGVVGVRNSRQPATTILLFTPDEWRAFIGGVRNGKFDRFSGASAPGVVQPLWKAADVVAYLANTVTEGTLANWRTSGKGPPYIKMGARGTEILYRPAAVEAWAAQFEKNRLSPA